MSGNDRSGCLWFCGMTWESIKNDCRLISLGINPDDLAAKGKWHRGGAGYDGCPGQRWCSDRCRDLALPPVDSSLATDAPAVSHHRHGGHVATNNAPAVGEKAGTASPPSPAPGQRWRMACGCVVDLGGERQSEPFDNYFRLASDVECRAEQYLTHTGWNPGVFSVRNRYLGPTPSPAPTPATPTPVTPTPSTVTGVGLCSTEQTGPIGGIRWGCALPAGHDGSHWCDRMLSTKAQAVPGIQCTRCLTTSEAGDIHLDACPVMRERGPSATKEAPGKARDTFADLADEWDLLPEAGR